MKITSVQLQQNNHTRRRIIVSTTAHESLTHNSSEESDGNDIFEANTPLKIVDPSNARKRKRPGSSSPSLGGSTLKKLQTRL